MMRESKYQKDLINKLEGMFPGCVILKNNPRDLQGIPDILILFRDRWAMLEVKPSANAVVQPNQVYYVDKFNDISFASFICPENEEEVLSELQHSFRTPREARLS
jgi:hypothetical protein